MRFKTTLYSFLMLILVSFSALAGKNPISWQLNNSFQNPIFPSGSYSVIYTFTNQLPLQLVQPLAIVKNASPANDFSYIDNCTGLRLTPQQSCTVQVNLNPSAAGQKSVQLIITGYDKNSIPLPSLSTLAIAQSNLIINGNVSQSLPGTLTIGTPSNFAFTFTNRGSATASGVSIQTNVSAFTTTCTSTLGPGKVCTVTGVYTPTSITPSVQSVNATFSYKEGSPVTVSTSTTIPPATGVIGSLISPNYLPPVMVGGSRTIQILFQNYGPGAATITSDPTTMVNITTGAGGSYVEDTSQPGNNSCTTGAILNVGAACQTLGTFTAPTVVSPTAYSVTATLTYSGGTGGPTATVITSTEVVSALSTNRTLTFVNQCGFPVWFSLNGGALAGSPNCTSNPAVCPTGTTCNQASGLCYWNNYAPGDNNYQLTTGHLSNTVTIPLTSADPTVQWSGNFSGSLQCHGSTCDLAGCQNNGGTSSCAPGIGFSQPATQAEITMLIAGADSYDVEVINGMHMPISMAPGPYVTPSNFSCGVPGSNSAGGGFGACSWTAGAIPPSYAYNMVTNLGACTGSHTCSTPGQICGLDAALDPVCGDFLGYWASDQACGVNATKADPYFGCNTPLSTISPPFPGSSVLSQLMACAVPTGDTTPTFNSCYLNYSSATPSQISTCCGCVDWWTVGGIGANSTAQSCTKNGVVQTDPTWTSSIQSQIQWLKQACPSIYTYPFDDATSGFNCTNNTTGASNSVGYTITFCPGGDTGLPATITEGRG